MKNVEERRNRTIAREANHHATMRAPHIDKTAISPYDDYCDGYGMPGAYGNGYVSVLKVSAGTVEKTNDELVDRIVTYDKAEAADAYVGQINMLTASSFCGMAGQVWGYDLARHDSVDNGKSKPLFTEKQWNGRELEVYDAAPLLSAGVELFGTEQNRRYHPIPGAAHHLREQGRRRLPPEDRPPAQGGRRLRRVVLHRHLPFRRSRLRGRPVHRGCRRVDRERQRRGHDRVPRAASQKLSSGPSSSAAATRTCCSTAPTWASLTA